MGLLSLLGVRQRVQLIQAQTSGNPEKTIITIDCTVSETHSRESPPTEWEVENGTMISDHIIVKPFTLDIQGIISDTPLNADTLGTEALTTAVGAVLPVPGIAALAAGAALYSTIAGSKSPSRLAYAQLLQLQASRQPFDVLTSLQRYPSMWIKSLSVPRDATTGQVLLFNLSLVQITIVSPQTVNVEILRDPEISTSQADAGTQQLQNKTLNATQQGFVNGSLFFGVTPP